MTAGGSEARQSSDQPPLVSIVMPVRNEAVCIEAALASILNQEDPDGGFEVIVADGRSDDATRQVLQGVAAGCQRLMVIDNPQGIVSTGLNAAIRAARGRIIVRMDAHSEYAPDYVRQCVSILQETGADNVGGPAQTLADTYVQKAVAAAYHSPFAAGGARFHNVDYEGSVDTVTYGCWRREAFERFGLFDEELVRNQDDEHNLRIIRGGGTVWQSPKIRSWYRPRSSLRALFRQYMQYGYWKVRVIQKHRLPASVRHLVPGGFVASLLLLALLAPWSRWGMLLLVALLGLYACANLAASLITCRRPANWKYLPVMPLTFAAYHFGYGWGFLMGVADFVVLGRGGRAGLSRLTR